MASAVAPPLRSERRLQVRRLSKLEEARHFAQEKQWREAEGKLREILEVTPGNLSALNILALCRFRQNDLQGAYDLYLRSLALDPKQSRVYASRASTGASATSITNAATGKRPSSTTARRSASCRPISPP